MYNSNIVCRYTGQSVWYVDGSTGNKSIDIDQPGLQIWQISTSSHFQRSFSSSNHGHIIVTLEQQGVSNGRIDPQRISAPPLSPLFPLPFSIPFSTSSSTPRFLLSYHLFFDFFFFPSYLSSIVFSFFFSFLFFSVMKKARKKEVIFSSIPANEKRERKREEKKKANWKQTVVGIRTNPAIQEGKTWNLYSFNFVCFPSRFRAVTVGP